MTRTKLEEHAAAIKYVRASGVLEVADMPVELRSPHAGKIHYMEGEVVQTLDNGAIVVTTDPAKMKDLREKRERAHLEELLSEKEYWVEEMETRAYTQSMIDDVDRRIAAHCSGMASLTKPGMTREEIEAAIRPPRHAHPL